METIEEKNRMIAEFMGYIVDFGFKKDAVLFHGEHIKLYNLKYHTSWDWLMPVVEKIDKLMLDQPIDSPFEINSEEVFTSLREVNIKLTFNRIVDFIEMYNQIK